MENWKKQEELREFAEEDVLKMKPEDNCYVCPNCGPADFFRVTGTIHVSAEEKVIDYGDDVIFLCDKCGTELEYREV